MPKDVYWFKHDANASDDIKLKALRKTYGWEGMGWYWHIIGLLRSEENYKLQYSFLTYDSLADDFKTDSGKVKSFLDECIKFELLTKDDNQHYFYSTRLLRDMLSYRQISEQNRINANKSVQARIAKYGTAAPIRVDKEHNVNERSASVEPPLSDTLTTSERPNEQGEERRGEESNKNNKNTTTTVFEFFEKNFGFMMTPYYADTLKDYEREYSAEITIAAMKESLDYGKRNLKYVGTILERWKTQGRDSNNGRKPEYNGQPGGRPAGAFKDIENQM